MSDRTYKQDASHIAVIFLGLLLAVWLMAVVPLAAVPPVSRDAMTHHLAVPKLYLRHGGMVELPSLVFSYYPMNVDLIYWLCLHLGTDILPKFIHLAFAMATAFLLIIHLRRRLNLAAGLMGAFLFGSLPIVVKLATAAYVDLALIFFSTAALLTLFKWAELDLRPRYLVYAAIWCGLAMGTKYNGLIVCLLLSALVAITYFHHAQPTRGAAWRGIAWSVLFIIISAIVFSPWAVRNVIWTGNPVYPLYNRVFDGSSHDMMPNQPVNTIHQFAGVERRPRTYNPFILRKVLYEETWWQTALIPARIFWQGRDDQPRFFDGRLNPLLLLLPLGTLLFVRPSTAARRFELRIHAAFAILYILFVFVTTDMRTRYIGPALPSLVVLSVHAIDSGVRRISRLTSKRSRWLLTAVGIGFIGLFLSLNAHYLVDRYRKVDPVPYLLGRIDRNTYLEQHLPEYATYRYTNRHLAQDAKLLGVFLGNRGYYLDRQVSFLQVEEFQSILHRVDSAEGLYRLLTALDFTHLVVGIDQLHFWQSRLLTHDAGNRLERFFEQFLDRQFSSGGYGLYRLVEGPTTE